MPSDTLVVSAVLTLAQKQGRAAELAEAARMAAEDVRDERAVLDQAAAATSRHTDGTASRAHPPRSSLC